VYFDCFVDLLTKNTVQGDSHKCHIP